MLELSQPMRGGGLIQGEHCSDGSLFPFPALFFSSYTLHKELPLLALTLTFSINYLGLTKQRTLANQSDTGQVFSDVFLTISVQE